MGAQSRAIHELSIVPRVRTIVFNSGFVERFSVSDLLHVIRSSKPSRCPLRPLPNRQKPTAYHGQK